MTGASTNSNAIVSQLMSRLRTYSTFQKAVATDDFDGMSRVRSFARNPWEEIDEVLDASLSRLLQHKSSEHFFAAVDRIAVETSRSPTKSRSRTVVEAGNMSKSDYTTLRAESGGSSAAADTSEDDLLYDQYGTLVEAWMREHPDATTQEIQREVSFWRLDRVDRDRMNRSNYLQQLRQELNALERSANSFPQPLRDAGLAVTMDTSASALPLFMEPMEEVEQQRTTWRGFLAGDEAPNGARSTDMAAGNAALPPSSVSPSAAVLGNLCGPTASAVGLASGVRHVVSQEPDSELHEWIQNRWRHHTHRHENAALVIQCAFRSYVAKSAAQRRRYARRQAFVECVRAEEAVRKTWDIALQVSREQHQTNPTTSRELRAVQFFIDKVNAIAVKRRARKQQEAEQVQEVRHYAAVTIQRVFRGYLGRERAKGARDPEYARWREERRYYKATLMVQAVWRGCITRRWLRRCAHAACQIQSVFRAHAARRQLHQLRVEQRQQQCEDLRHFAATVIQRFYRSHRSTAKRVTLAAGVPTEEGHTV